VPARRPPLAAAGDLAGLQEVGRNHCINQGRAFSPCYELNAGADAAPRANSWSEYLTRRDGEDWWRRPTYSLSPAEVSQLIEHLAAASPEERARAASTLAEGAGSSQAAVPALARALADEDRTVRWNALYALAYIGYRAKAAIPALRALLDADGTSLGVFAGRVLWTVDAKQEVVPRLIELLDAEDAEARRQSLRLIDEIMRDTPRLDLSAAIPPLLRWLDDPLPSHRKWAIDELSYFAPPEEIIPVLLRVFATETDDEVRRVTALALHTLENRRGE
jgi:HEAT repeat protein